MLGHPECVGYGWAQYDSTAVPLLCDLIQPMAHIHYWPTFCMQWTCPKKDTGMLNQCPFLLSLINIDMSHNNVILIGHQCYNSDGCIGWNKIGVVNLLTGYWVYLLFPSNVLLGFAFAPLVQRNLVSPCVLCRRCQLLLRQRQILCLQRCFTFDRRQCAFCKATAKYVYWLLMRKAIHFKT